MNEKTPTIVGEKVQLTLRLPIELYEALKNEANVHGYTVKDLALIIVYDYLL